MKNKYCLPFFLIFLVFALTSCSGPEEKGRKFFDKGKALYEQGDYVKARLEFKNALRIDPEFADGFHMLGMAEMNTRNYQGAYQAFQNAVGLDPGQLASQLEMGKLLLISGDSEEALKKAELILRNDPQHREAGILKGTVCLQENKIDEAIAFIKGQVKNHGRTAELYMLLASAHVMKKDLSTAEEVLKDGISRNVDSVPLLLELARLYNTSGKLNEAEDIIKTVIKLAPDHLEHKFSLASLCWARGREQDAESLIEEIIKTGRDDSNTVTSAALFYVKREELMRAEEVLEEGIRSIPKDVQLRMLLGELYVKTGNRSLAKKTLEEALLAESDPGDNTAIQIKTVLARLHLSQNELEQAKAYVAGILKYSPNNLEGLMVKGYIFLQQGENENAVSQFRIVVNDRPDYVPGYLALAKAHLANNEISLAKDTVKDSLSRDPTSKEALRAMAGLFTQTRDYAGVEENLRKIAEIAPQDLRAQTELGDFLLARSQYGEAEEIYRKIRQMEPHVDTLCVRLARLYTRQGRVDKATEELEAHARSGFVSNPVLTALVQHYIEQKRYGDAIALCEKRLSEGREDPLALNILGTVYIQLSQYEKAETAFFRAIEINPDFRPALKNLAGLKKIQGRIEEVIQYLYKAIQVSPRDVSGYVSLAMLFDQRGDVGKAIETYEKGLGTNPGSWALKNNLAFMISHRFDTKEYLERALELATEAHKAQSGNPVVLDTLGWANWRLDNFEEAYHYLNRALMVDPENCSANYHLAVVLKAMGKDNQARERLTKSLEGEEEFAGRNEAEEMLKEMGA